MEGFLSELDRYLFGNGRHYKIYEKMGAHPACFEGQEGIHFAVWAPHARRVSIVCDRNGWNPDKIPCFLWKVPESMKASIPEWG